MTTINQQTPGPVRAGHARSTVVSEARGYAIADMWGLVRVGLGADPAAEDALETEARANARLFAAAFNAFDDAGRKLGIDAASMAERLGSVGLAQVAEALGAVLADAGVQADTPLHPEHHSTLAQVRAALTLIRGE